MSRRYVVTAIQVGELKQAMADGVNALADEATKENLVGNVLVVREVYEHVPPDIIMSYEDDPVEAAGASFSFGIHTGMELQRRIAKTEPERLIAADMAGVIERLVARNDGGQNVYVPDFGYVSLDVAVAAIAAAAVVVPA